MHEIRELFPPAIDRQRERSYQYKNILGKEGSSCRIGSVRSLEVTMSVENGWHPHTHDLVFTKASRLGRFVRSSFP